MMPQYKNALFISDLHLTEDRPDCIRAFFSFLEWIPADTEALFILGDFFEYWVGDDIETPLSKTISEKLAHTVLSKKLSLYFIAGNRDFSISQKYCDKCNMTLLIDNTLFKIADKLVLLSHGDLMCTDDKTYQRFRKIIRNKFVLSLLLSLSKSRRVQIAERLRKKSKDNFKKHSSIVDVNALAVKETFKRYGGEIMVHGHTHLADIHHHNHNDKKLIRVVLGDWHTVGWYAKIDKTGETLNQFSIVEPTF